MTPTEAITALEKALEAQPLTVPGVTFAEKADIRTLLDAHAGALRDAERFRFILNTPSQALMTETQDFAWTNTMTPDEARAAIDAALATNTKAQP